MVSSKSSMGADEPPGDVRMLQMFEAHARTVEAGIDSEVP